MQFNSIRPQVRTKKMNKKNLGNGSEQTFTFIVLTSFDCDQCWKVLAGPNLISQWNGKRTNALDFSTIQVQPNIIYLFILTFDQFKGQMYDFFVNFKWQHKDTLWEWLTFTKTNTNVANFDAVNKKAKKQFDQMHCTHAFWGKYLLLVTTTIGITEILNEKTSRG